MIGTESALQQKFCHGRPAISFKYGDAVVNKEGGYDLYPRCLRSMRDSNMAAMLAQTPIPPTPFHLKRGMGE